MGRRKKRRTPSPPPSPEEIEYFVEVIMAARKSGSEWEYLVKWYGFGDEDSSWEPTENFHDCERLLNSFWMEVGEHRRERTREGIEVIPGKQWIEKEKKFFKKTREAEEKADQEAAQESGPNDSDENDIPLRELVGKGPVVVESSDDDEPLSATVRRPPTFKETGLLQPRKQKPGAIIKTAGTAQNKLAKKATGADVSSSKKQNKLPPTTPRPPPLILTRKPEPGPSRPREGPSTAKSPTETSLSRGQMANQAAGSNHRSTGKTQILPYAIKSSSGLSTKARIAEDMTKGVISQGQSKYKGMRIPRKAIPPGESRPPVPPTATNSQLPLESPQGAPSPHSPSEHSNRTQIQKGALQKRLPLQPEEPPHDVESDHMDVDQPEPPPSPLRPENLIAAEDLLHTIIPQQNLEMVPKVPDQPTTRWTANLKLSQFSKKDTNWSGALFNSVSEKDAEKLCEVTIQDHTHARTPMKLDLFLQKSDSIRLRKFHDLADLDLLLPSFQYIAQFASLVPCEEKDKEAFTTMQKYLSRKGKFTYCTLSFANEVQTETDTVAYMFITPMSKSAFNLLGVSDRAEEDNALLVALAPLIVSTKKYQEEIAIFKTTEEAETRFPVLPDLQGSVSPSTYHLARQILRLPKSLAMFLSSSNPRPCVIWPQEDTVSDGWISQDTQYLRFILDHHRAQVFSPKEHVAARIVFVHVGKMKDIHTMPRIARLRAAPLDLQFLTYGTHPSIPARHWGIRGFNICGGILAFTPNALVKGPDSVDGLIERVANHEHWACYVTPIVLGAAVQRAKELGNPALAAVISDRLGKRISEGKMSCMIAPPANAHLGRHTRDCDTWVEYQNMQSQLDPHEIVEDCEGMYEDAYDRVSKRDRDGLLLSDLQRDLAKMSNQPAIRYAYRRFVIIGSNADVHGRPDEEGWCEWTTVSGFSFGEEDS